MEILAPPSPTRLRFNSATILDLAVKPLPDLNTHATRQGARIFLLKCVSISRGRSRPARSFARTNECRESDPRIVGFLVNIKRNSQRIACSNVYVCRAIEIVRCVVYVFICIFMKM
ncbi:hypothetical protein AVEN_220352-1 [Araneus ventricosus]|uniref:Uncharacterized protein n=1 Tax=Araneus ventricosus TaxID=182803 RepID=A0A4Y2LTT1_ARAVE|nr:hypothetical protein AVEN_220352-1 [Araneus ventricosus]